MQQMPDIEKTISERDTSCPKRTFKNARKKVCVNQNTDADKLNIVFYGNNMLPKNLVPQR